MKLIIISGPSGSGKTYLSNKLISLFSNSILLNTDSYYKDSIIVKDLSLYYHDIYDRIYSIKFKQLSNTIHNILSQQEEEEEKTSHTKTQMLET